MFVFAFKIHTKKTHKKLIIVVTNKGRTKENKVDRDRIENSQYRLYIVLVLSHTDA